MANALNVPMEAQQPQPASHRPIDWEAFYGNFRKPGYIAGFEIVTKLGGGVFGMVFKARKESIGKDYAIKFLKVDEEPVRDAVIRELDSVRYFAQVDHPNLVSIEDKGEVDGIPYIVMSYAGQETLRTRLANGSLPREEALKVFIQAARGVQALHEHSLVHFDLKPANIFLKGDIARVGDYGLSKLVTESRNSLSFGRGTPYYMAPEMLQRRGDQRSDIYSLGILLYECLTGDVPFKGDSEWEVLRKHEQDAPRFPDSVGAAERRVIERCLAKDPEQRFQTVKQMLQALQAPASLGESVVLPAFAASPPAAGTGPGPAAAAATAIAPEAAGMAVDTSADHAEVASPGRAEAGLIGGLVHAVFRLFEFTIFLALVPIRALSVVLGRTLVFLLRLPFRILGVAVTLAGYLVVALVMLLLTVGVLSLLTV